MYFNEYEHEIVEYQSLPADNPFAPEWKIPLLHSYVKDPQEFNADLRAYAETIQNPDYFKKDDLILEFDGWSTEEANRLPEYNFLDTDNFAVQEFKHFIRQAHDRYCEYKGISIPDEVKKTMKVQCWVNILSKGMGIKPHNHFSGPNSWLSGNYSVTADVDTYTAFYAPSHEIRVTNHPGMLVMFPSYVGHYAKEYEGDDKRITIAFDIYFDKLSQWGGEYDALEGVKFYA